MRFHTDGGLLVTGSLIKSTPQRVRRVARKRVVKRNSCEKHVLCFAIVTSVLEAYVTESVSYYIIIRIVGAEENGRIVGIARIFHIEFGIA